MTYAHTPCTGCGKKYQPGPKPEPFVRGDNVSFGRARSQPDGSIVYPKKGWEPPPPIEGYVRDPGNAWRFVPLWPICGMRQKVMVKKVCGAISIKMICKCSDCPLFQSDIVLLNCENCNHRRP